MSLVFCSDIHLSDTKPPCRLEDDWIATQQNMLDELIGVAESNEADLVICGDFFDKPKVSPRLLNMVLGEFAMSNVHIHIMPGQHDIYGHNVETMPDCSLYALDFLDNVFVYSSVTHNVNTKKDIAFTMVPFGMDTPPALANKWNVACIHEFAWEQKPDFIESESGFCRNMLKNFRKLGYTHVFVGDNHKPFEDAIKGCSLWNCGSLQRTKSDQESHVPQVYLMQSDGTVETIRFPFRDQFQRIEHTAMPISDNLIREQLQGLFSGETEQRIGFDSMMEVTFVENDIPQEVIDYVRKMIN